MFKSNFRLTAFIDEFGDLQIKLSEDKEDSHRKMYQQLMEDISDSKRNFDIPIYGRFYSLLYGNSRRPQLIIYGWSSDYGQDELSYNQDKYENLIRSFALSNKFDLLFLP